MKAQKRLKKGDVAHRGVMFLDIIDWDEESRQGEIMEVTVQIPDDIANRMTDAGVDLSRRALEALVAEEYRQGHLHKPTCVVCSAFETSPEIDGFLKSHNVYDEYTMEDFERERQTLKSLAF